MSLWRRLRTGSSPSPDEGASIDDERAVELARAAVEGKVDLPDDGPVSVNRRGQDVVVEFVHVNPPGTRGADYDAQVTLDATTGKVRQVLGGS